MSRFKLRKTISQSANADPNDLVSAKQALSALGYYPAPADGVYGDWADRNLFNGIQRFQQRNGLRVDGVMKPNGPTENAVNNVLSGKYAKPTHLDALENVLGCSCQDSDDHVWRMS